MTDPTPETTPTRDEAVRGELPIWKEGWIAERLSAAMHAYLAEYVWSPDEGCDHEPSEFERMIMEDMLNGALSAKPVENLLQDAAFAMLASAPAPASGRVDAELIERARHAARVERTMFGFKAGELYDALADALSPAATPVSEAEPVALPDDRELPPMTERGLVGQLMDAAWPHYGGNNQPADFWNDFGEGIRFALHYLAKPASSPAGGDVVELVAAIIDPAIWAIEQPIPTRGHVEDFHQRRRSSCELAQRIIAALSQSTSAGRG